MIRQKTKTILHLPVHSFRRQLVIVLLCLWVAVASSQDVGTDNIISCSVPPVKPLQDTVLTCHFPEDLNITKKGFSVYHSVTGVSPDVIIDCWWLNNNLDCYAQPDFQYNKTVGTNLTVTIKEVTTKLTGIYFCQVDGYGGSSVKNCELKFDIGNSDNCNIVQSENESQAIVTCFFNEDISKTKKQFAVYKHNGRDKQIVANCSWEEARPRCQMENGYLNSDDVSYYTTFRIPHVTRGKWGNYSCWHEGSVSGQQETCHLDVDNNEKPVTISNKTDKTLVIVLGSLTVTLLLAAVIVFMVVFKRKIPFRPHFIGQQNGETDVENSLLMTGSDDAAVLTDNFMHCLVDDVKKMYPEILDTCYFVPPVYFNKTRYKTYSVADTVFYSPVIPDITNAKDMSSVRHDRAMQHVLHCLHHLADQRQEKMFVITQFNYDDYLNNPGSDFQQHRLPVPSGLVDEDEDVACFDFLMVHREHGVLVGVVKAVSDKVEDSKDGQQDEGGCIVTAVTEAVQQLQKANRVIRHVMSDQQHFPTVHQTLILPNLPRASLGRAVAHHTDLVERLRDCVGVTATEDPTKQCLCVEDLSDPSTPWVVTSDVVNRIRDRWKWTCARVDDIVVMTEELYLTVIARFCRPATQSTLDIQDEPYLLPKTLAEAVSLTGDLYERWTLHPHMIEILNEKRLFLVGPASEDKMRMLTLVVKMWLSHGHQVYILSESSEPGDSGMSLLWDMLITSDDRAEDGDPSRGHLTLVHCDLRNNNEVNKTLTTLNVKEGSSPCVIVEKNYLNRSHFKSFCETLISRCPVVYFWATSNTINNVPDGWTVKTFTRTFTSPPAVVRAVLNVAAIPVTPGDEGKPTCLPPTDGPPVKYFNHVQTGQWTVHECKDCSKEVADFLIKHLLTTNDGKDLFVRTNDLSTHDVSATNTQTTPGDNKSTTLNRASILQKKDVLVLFESDTDRMNQFLTGLNECGIAVSRLQYVKGKYEFTGEQDSVRALHVDHLRWHRARKKVVVYVEQHRGPEDVSEKHLAVTTCTSQLIVIRGNH